LVGQHAETVNVASRIDTLTGDLFGTHVARRAEGHARSRQSRVRLLVPVRERDAKVHEQGLAVLKHHVVRLKIAMDDAVAMGIIEGARELAGDAQRALKRQLTLPLSTAAHP